MYRYAWPSKCRRSYVARVVDLPAQRAGNYGGVFQFHDRRHPFHQDASRFSDHESDLVEKGFEYRQGGWRFVSEVAFRLCQHDVGWYKRQIPELPSEQEFSSEAGCGDGRRYEHA